MRAEMKSRNAFTLIELLAVIAIIGVLAAIVAPSLNNLRKGDATLAAARQLQGAAARARQLAISQHTTVYMVFVPAGFWLGNNAPSFNLLTPEQRAAATNVLDDQLVGYTYLTKRSIGDQPGRRVARYIDPWRKLPEGSYIPEWKFTTGTIITTNHISRPPETFIIRPFQRTGVPFPAATNVAMQPFAFPFIAFDYLGRLVKGDGETPLGYDEFIPLAHGSITHSRNPATRQPMINVPSTIELPPGNSTNSYNMVRIDWLTGRARLETRRML